MLGSSLVFLSGEEVETRSATYRRIGGVLFSGESGVLLIPKRHQCHDWRQHILSHWRDQWIESAHRRPGVLPLQQWHPEYTVPMKRFEEELRRVSKALIKRVRPCLLSDED